MKNKKAPVVMNLTAAVEKGTTKAINALVAKAKANFNVKKPSAKALAKRKAFAKKIKEKNKVSQKMVTKLKKAATAYLRAKADLLEASGYLPGEYSV